MDNDTDGWVETCANLGYTVIVELCSAYKRYINFIIHSLY